MHRQWIAMEHYRLHCVEQWPDSPYKQAVLGAIHSALERLRTTSPVPPPKPECSLCASRVRQFGGAPHDSTALAQLAA
jgi:hypothetical protein